MGKVHDLLAASGRASALLSNLDRRVIDAASSYMGDEDNGLAFLFSGWCQAALPHRKLPDDEAWQIDSGRVTLVVEPGFRPGPGGKPSPVGVPYGSRARLICLYLQGQAMASGSRDVELGGSLREWLVRMGIPIGGKSYQQVRDQTERIGRCRITFNVQGIGGSGMVSRSIVESAIFLDDGTDGQGSLFTECARLSEAFFDALKKHPVPVEESAVRAISNNSAALDAYAWLAYRLHSLTKPTPISWPALKSQFGASFDRMDNFRARFTDSLALAMAVYPAARVDTADKGIVLHPCPPPVAPRKALR